MMKHSQFTIEVRNNTDVISKQVKVTDRRAKV
jgi:hypothetical protein